MRISAFSSPISYPYSRRQPRGFTLIEMMVVLVVIGVVIAMATLALGSNPANTVDREGRRLQALLEQASEEAVMQSEELALALSNDADSGATQYQLLVLDKEELQWKRPEFDGQTPRLWLVHTLDPEISVQLELEGEQLSQQQLEQLSRVRSLDTPDGLNPSILLLSSGELTPFSLRLSHRQIDYSVAVESDGFSGVYLQ